MGSGVVGLLIRALCYDCVAGRGIIKGAWRRSGDCGMGSLESFVVFLGSDILLELPR
jgi:hypothetical protein